jgi:hypothetical protein
MFTALLAVHSSSSIMTQLILVHTMLHHGALERVTDCRCLCTVTACRSCWERRMS